MEMALASAGRRVKGQSPALQRPESIASEESALPNDEPGIDTAELRLDRVAKSFGNFPAVRPTSLTITASEVTGLIGPNGAGKTTLFGLMDGLYRSDGGGVWLSGK